MSHKNIVRNAKSAKKCKKVQKVKKSEKSAKIKKNKKQVEADRSAKTCKRLELQTSRVKKVQIVMMTSAKKNEFTVKKYDTPTSK